MQCIILYTFRLGFVVFRVEDHSNGMDRAGKLRTYVTRARLIEIRAEVIRSSAAAGVLCVRDGLHIKRVLPVQYWD